MFDAETVLILSQRYYYDMYPNVRHKATQTTPDASTPDDDAVVRVTTSSILLPFRCAAFARHFAISVQCQLHPI